MQDEHAWYQANLSSFRQQAMVITRNTRGKERRFSPPYVYMGRTTTIAPTMMALQA